MADRKPPNKAELLHKLRYFFSHRHVLKHAQRAGGRLPLDVYVPSYRDHRALISILIERIRECAGAGA